MHVFCYFFYMKMFKNYLSVIFLYYFVQKVQRFGCHAFFIQKLRHIELY